MREGSPGFFYFPRFPAEAARPRPGDGPPDRPASSTPGRPSPPAGRRRQPGGPPGYAARTGGSDRPVLDAQAGDTTEVTPVAGDDHRLILQRDGGDTQVHEPNVKPEGLELGDPRDG
jgi:hypothetical protein